MTKEEILKIEYGKLITNPEKVFYQNPSIITAAYISMQEYADQEAKEFNRWIRKQNLKPYAGDQWLNRKVNMVFTTDQLYEQYKDEKIKNDTGERN